MKHIIEKWEQNIYASAFWDFYFGGLKTGILDIETTGLNPGQNKFILGGLYDVTKGEIHQVLAASRAEEPLALAEYLKLIADVDMVVTYNGRHFDMPFIEKRRQVSADSINCRSACLLPYDLDLYLVLSGHSPIRKLVPNMKQKTVEEYMGFWDTRADEISGAESVRLFNHYEATKDPIAEEKILLHNNDDVRQLTRLTKAIIKSDFHKAMNKLGFPVKLDDYMVIVKKIHLEKDTLCVSGIQNKSPINYMGFEFNGQPVTSMFHANSAGRINYGSTGSGTFEIKVPLVCRQGYKVADLEAFWLEGSAAADETECTGAGFADYPGCGSGFLVIEDHGEIRYRELNHFAKAFIGRMLEEII